MAIEHKFVDGRDGLQYHCIRCGISKCDDFTGYDCKQWKARSPTWKDDVRQLKSKKYP